MNWAVAAAGLVIGLLVCSVAYSIGYMDGRIRQMVEDGPARVFGKVCTRPTHPTSPCNGLPRPDCPGYENWKASAAHAP